MEERWRWTMAAAPFPERDRFILLLQREGVPAHPLANLRWPWEEEEVVEEEEERWRWRWTMPADPFPEKDRFILLLQREGGGHHRRPLRT